MTIGAKIPVVDDKMKGRTLLPKASTEMSAFSAAVVHTAAVDREGNLPSKIAEIRESP